MAYYVCESYDFSVDHNGRESQGVVGDNPGSEKIYLHVLPLSDQDLTKLKVRVDEFGNKQSHRLALPGRDDFWVGIDGEVTWPKIVRPKLGSRCDVSSGKPVPAALSADDVERLKKAGVKGL
ncbi:MAG: hypothetical protein IPK82_29685 [Polyangiaceae bacterium]|nr:hypothetical protein [Polyangiaceae bacterium]